MFWAEAVASLGAANGDLAALAPPPRGALRPFLTTVLNMLAGLDEPPVLVIDDLHLAGASDVIDDLEWFLENAPSRFRLVAATRSDPLFRLQRMRVAGTMTEVRAADLAFTLDETKALLGALDVGAEACELLWRRTEGWVTGLKLAQLSLAGNDDPGAFVEGFTGADMAVSDYLVSEVIARQPPETLEFLLRTARDGARFGRPGRRPHGERRRRSQAARARAP